ncbi:MAG: acetoacetate metabolism regulatory protein AtoC [Verrucomicrobiales bacterium]|nr:acetoacetate metabolism regulatory protein AtoC [Verrucomicrobiales bacterium]
MKPSATNWVAIVQTAGKCVSTHKLPEGITTIGRDPHNQIPLPHSSVSREHAEINCVTEGLSVRDLGSRNGILVNGVPRKKALLQAGDKISICDFVIEVATSMPAETSSGSKSSGLAAALQLDQTIDLRPRLPEAKSERQLATLYHVCFWIAEGVEEKAFVERCLNLLLVSLYAREVHYYSAGPELKAVITEDGGKPAVKLAAFLAKKFQEPREASIFRGVDIAVHQRGVGNFNYLVCPLSTNTSTAAPAAFVVVVRAEEQQDFTPEDRVLVQAICQLWVRGQAKTMELCDLRQQNAKLKEKLSGPVMIGSSEPWKRLIERARKMAGTSSTILLNGETGSGKEVLTQFLHENSPRKSGPLVKMNCAAIPDSLIESELFGYSKGAFSGATRDYNGKFVQANGGTLFLDEIGEMPLLVQAKVLRAIENREVQPLGTEATTHVDIRIIAATNRDLREMVAQKQFREDLYYRLDVQNIRIPALRDHPEDIDELAKYFLDRCCAENGLAEMELAPEALAALRGHTWPGNVRELFNVIQRCALGAEDIRITKPNVLDHIRR